MIARTNWGGVGKAIACAILAMAWEFAAPPAVRAQPGDATFSPAVPGYDFHFPRDHGSHPEFRTEWWYTTGHYWVGEAGERPPDGGFQLTFFRSGVARNDPPRASAWAAQDLYFTHFTLTDLRSGASGERFHVAEKIGRDALGMAGADTASYHVWIDDWEARAEPDGTQRLRAETQSHAIALRLVPQKPPVVHGRDGVSVKGPEPGQASHYISITRLALDGEVRIGGDRMHAEGQAWMDHEFTTGELPPDLAGWDWFGLQLDDGSELMFYGLRRADGSLAPESSGSWVAPDGTHVHLPAAAAQGKTAGTWKSPVSGATYPASWNLRVQVPGTAGVAARFYELEIEPELAAQELVTRESTGVTYWEGACRVRGTRDGASVAGYGYVELTGYAGAFRARM